MSPHIPRIGVVGLGGFARVHLAMISSLQAAGSCQLVAVADPYAHRHEETVNGLLRSGTLVFPELEAMLGQETLDAVFVATPLHLHAAQTIMALNAGCHVYVEKPPCITLREWQAMRFAEMQSGRRCAVGFLIQSTPSMLFLQRQLAEGLLGTLRRVWCGVRWPRADAYYQRAPWAGRWEMDGQAVCDGPATNALAHVLQAALSLAAAAPGQVARVQRARGAMWRARPMESYDTCYLEAVTEAEVRLQLALTHAALHEDTVALRLEGDLGEAELRWDGMVRLAVHGKKEELLRFHQQPAYSAMSQFLNAIRCEGPGPLVSLEHTLPYMHLVNALLQCTRGIQNFPPQEVLFHQGQYSVPWLEQEVQALQDKRSPGACPLLEEGAPWLVPDLLQADFLQPQHLALAS